MTYGLNFDFQCERRLQSLVTELFIRGLTLDMNDIETVKLETNKEDKEKQLLEIEQRMAVGFLELSAIFDSNPLVARECLLTAFSLHPTHDKLLRLKEVGMEYLVTSPSKTFVSGAVQTTPEKEDKAKVESPAKAARQLFQENDEAGDKDLPTALTTQTLPRTAEGEVKEAAPGNDSPGYTSPAHCSPHPNVSSENSVKAKPAVDIVVDTGQPPTTVAAALGQSESRVDDPNNADENVINNADESVSKNADETVSKNADEAVIKNADETVSNNTDETVSNNTDETVSNSAGEAVSNNADETVSKNADETVSKNADETVSKNTDETVSNNTDETVSKNTDETVSKNADETVSKNADETVSKILMNL